MNLRIKALWLNALINGKYTQGFLTLRRAENDTFCAMGVLVDLYQQETKDGQWQNYGYEVTRLVDPEKAKKLGETQQLVFTSALPDFVKEWAELDRYTSVVRMNDLNKASFDDIAHHISAEY
jgi:hypothetical protein